MVIRILGLQMIDKILKIMKCDAPERLGDFTLKFFEGEEAANEYWEKHPSVHLEPRNHYDSD